MNYKIITALLLISFSVKAHISPNRMQYIETRTYHRLFSVNETALLKLENKYGKVHITTWNRNEIEVTATIKYGHRSERVAKDKINCININAEAGTDYVQVKTVFNCDISNRQYIYNDGKRIRLTGPKIDYEIKIPDQGKLDLTNKYGNIVLGDIKGETKINLKYGSLAAQTLNGNHNILKLNYSSSSTIQSANQLDIETDYSDLSIGLARNIQLDTNYTNISIDEIGKIVESNMDYGNLNIGTLGDMKLSADYVNLIIEKLHKNLALDMDYGSYKINAIENGFTFIKIDNKYTDGRIKVNKGTPFKFYTKTHFGNIYLSPDIKVYKQLKNLYNTTFEGTYNTKTDVHGTINITSDYGDINIKIKK